MDVTCNVIRDLMPLYADGMLCEDSCLLVEEHCQSCELCRKELEQLCREENADKALRALERDAINAVKKREKDERDEEYTQEQAVTALRGIRRSIVRKRIFAVCIAVVCALAAARIGYYFYAEKESYLSLEESGLEMRGEQLYATRIYYGRLRGITSPDQKVLFLCETETGQLRLTVPAYRCNIMVMDFGNQLEDESEWDKIENENKLRGIEKVYYLSEENARYHFDYEDLEKGAQQTRELEAQSILLWEKQEGSYE